MGLRRPAVVGQRVQLQESRLELVAPKHGGETPTADSRRVYRRIDPTVRERFELRRQVDAVTAQQRLSSTVLTVLPFGLLMFLFVMDRSFVEPLVVQPRDGPDRVTHSHIPPACSQSAARCDP